MRSSFYRSLELFLLFILLPVSFLLDYPIEFKVALTSIGFVYILIQLKRAGLKLMFPDSRSWRLLSKAILVKLIIIMLITSLYVLIVDPDKLFSVLINNPRLWVLILFIYTFLSVWP